MLDQQDSGSPAPDYISRNEALSTLHIKPQTLYAYVSRGLIRRQPGPDGRRSLYNRHDIAGIRARSIARSGHGPAAASAAHWGEPLLVTRITEITPQGPRYRDHLAVDLARAGTSFETLAEYLWTGTRNRVARWPLRRRKPAVVSMLAEIFRRRPDIHIGQLMAEFVLLSSIEDGGDKRDGETLERARGLLIGLAGVFGLLGPAKAYVESKTPMRLADTILQGVGVARTAASRRMLDAALILVADHEFSPATFTARIAASSGSDLYACVAAALQVHFGSEFGLRCDRVEQELGRSPVMQVAGCDCQRLLRLPRTGQGFAHPLYKRGDPRAHMLLALALTGLRRTACADCESTIARLAEGLTLDEALVLFCQALGMPKKTAGALLAFGRVAGWIAHVLEQRTDGTVIRPRAKFIRS